MIPETPGTKPPRPPLVTESQSVSPEDRIEIPTIHEPVKIWVDRSRVDCYRRCPERRRLGYELREPGSHSFSPVGGFQPKHIGFDIPIGSGFHKALEIILGWAIDLTAANQGNLPGKWFQEWLLEDAGDPPNAANLDIAVGIGLKEFDLEVGDWLIAHRERIEMSRVAPDQIDPFDFPLIQGDEESLTPYAYLEARAMVEALVRAYVLAPTGLRWLLDTYQIIAAEQEITVPIKVRNFGLGETTVMFMGRPDGILLDRKSGHYYVLSFKTTKTWNKSKEQLGRFDDQGLSETFVGDYWLNQIMESRMKAGEINLKGFNGNYRVSGVQMVYLLKGEKRQDKYHNNEYRYNNGLIRPWVKQEQLSTTSTTARRKSKKEVSDEARQTSPIQLDWEWEDPSGAGHTLGKGWKLTPAWEYWGETGVRYWVHAIANQQVDLNGYSEVGYDWKHPLDKYVVNPLYYRNESDVQEWIRQMVAQEVGLYHNKIALEAGGVGAFTPQWRVDQAFPKFRHSCTYPVPCEFIPVCHEGVDLAGSGLYKIRRANHPQEAGGSSGG